MACRIGVLVAFGALALPASAFADINVTEGQQFSGQVGTFTENCAKDPELTGVYDCSDLQGTATIDWGTGDTTTATVVKKNPAGGSCLTSKTYSSCVFYVSGTYTYPEDGTDAATANWSVTDVGTGITSTGSFGFNANIADATIALSNASIARSGQNATLSATLTDNNPDGQPCDFTVTIEWGDGTSSSGVVNNQSCVIFARKQAVLAPEAPTSATFSVSGSHTYAVEPNTDASVTVTDGDQSANSTVQVPRPAQTTTEAASNIGSNGATLNAYVDPQGGQMQDCHFEWGTTASYGHTAPCSPATFTTPQSVTAALGSLAASTTYHFQVVVTTNVGTVNGGDQSFTTLAPVIPGAPTVATSGAGSITATSAVLVGSVNPNGHTLSDCHFEWGTTTSYGHSAACSPGGASGGEPVAVSSALSGLSPDTTYHFRLVAANPGAPPSYAADVSFTTLPTCDVKVTFGYVDATGCLADNGSTYKSTPGTAVQVNGLTLTPDRDYETITLTPSAGRIYASGAFAVSAGPVTLYDGQFVWIEPAPGGRLSVPIGSVTPPPLAKVAGMPLQGDLSLSFDNKSGADFTGNVQLPLGGLAGPLGINGTIVLHTLPGYGLLTDQLQITRGDFSLLGVSVKNLKVIYTPGSDSWEGSADIGLPTPNQLDIGADLSFQHGQFHEFSGSVDGLNFPIIAGVELQRISVVFGVNPTTIGGGLGLSFGPQVGGKSLVRIDGDFLYRAATATAAGLINVNGTLTLASIKVANAYFDYYTTRSVSFGAQVQFGLPDTSSSDPSSQPVYISAGLAGAISGSHFDAEVKATAALNFIHLSVGADILVSDYGLVACGSVSAFGFTWSPGAGYVWSTGSLDLMLTGCSVGPYETLPVSQASAAAATRRIRFHTARSLLELKGTSAPPKVILRGPHGQRVSVPTESVRPMMVHGFMVFQDPNDHLTWIAIQHSLGTWRMTLEAGSSPIAAIRMAGLLAQPHVTGHVGGKGRSRTLTWRLRSAPGQRVVFWEKGRGVARVIGATSAGRGSLRFTPANAPSRGRMIDAQVFSYGRPRADITIARYTAPRMAAPGRIAKLRVAAVRGGAIKVSWTGAALAQQYVIVVHTSGARLVEFAGGRARSIIVRNVVPIKAASVSVRASLLAGAMGPAATTRFPIAKPKHKTRRHR